MGIQIWTSSMIRTLANLPLSMCTLWVVSITTFKAIEESIWFKMFLMGLGVIPLVVLSIIMFYDNNKTV